MKITICCPSRGRSHLSITRKWLKGFRTFVAEEEVETYRLDGWPNVETQLNEAVGNLSRIRNHIVDLATEQGYDAVFIIDDDCHGVCQYVGPRKAKRMLSSDEVWELAETMAIQGREAGVHFVGMNQNSDPGSYRVYSPISFTNPVLVPFSGILLPCPYRFDPALPLKEDYDFSLQALAGDRRIMRWNNLHYISAHLNLEGGAAYLRTTEREIEQFNLLQKKWGKGIVKPGNTRRKGTKKDSAALDPNPTIKVPIPGI